MKRLYFSLAVLSVVYFLIITIDLFFGDYNSPLAFLWNIYLLGSVSVLGILFSVISVKGSTRISMLFIIILFTLFHLLMYFVATFGFREP